MDKYKIDSHKLIYHPKRVSDWSEGKNIYPIYAEISPSRACNHRCLYCALDFMEYKRIYLDANVLKDRLLEMASLGLRSIMYAGEGEPLLHEDFKEIVEHTKQVGIDVAITTNGSLLNNSLAESILPNCTWIKISINGATNATYSKIHGISPKSQNFDKVISNLTYASELRNKYNYKCTLGMQLLLLSENWHEAELLAKTAKEIGMDYLVIKPYSQHPSSKTKLYKNIKYTDYLHLSNNLTKFNDQNFHVVFRINTMKKWDSASHDYDKCQALPFWTYIDSEGNVWGCSVYLGDERFLYGNIYKQSFRQIWNGEQRRASLEYVDTKLNVSQCRINCRMDEINRYLWELTHPSEHVKFI